MDIYCGDGGSQRESQGEWSQNFEWMQEMAAQFSNLIIQFQKCYRAIVCFHLL